MSEFVWRMSPTQIGTRARNVIATVVVATVIAGAAALTTPFSPFPPSPPSSGTANIWVDTSGGTCADSTTLISYPNNGTECPDLSDAYAAAEAGDVIGLRTGSYAGDTIVWRSALDNLSPGCDPYGEWGSISTVNCVKVFPDGGTVTFTGELLIRASALWIAGTATGAAPNFPSRTYNIVIDSAGGSGFVFEGTASGNLNVFAAAAGQGVDHVVLEGIHSHTFEIKGADHVLYRDSDAGPVMRQSNGAGGCLPPPENKIQDALGGTVQTSFVTLDRIFFHGQSTNDTGNCHTGGMIMQNAIEDIIIRNSAELQNVAYSIQTGATSFNRFTLENNYFGCHVNPGAGGTCANKLALNLSAGTYTDWLIRYNVFYDNNILDTGGVFNTSNYVGNIAEGSGSDPFCSVAGLNRDFNVFAPGNCLSDTNGSDGNARTDIWVSPDSSTAPDFHLLNTSNIANNYVSAIGSAYLLATDFDGETRPQDVNRDAGPDERDSP